MTEMASTWMESGAAIQWLAQIKSELRHIDVYRLTQTALRQGVSVTDSGSFSTGSFSPVALRVSLGGAIDRNRLTHGPTRLAEWLKGDLARRVSNVV